MRRRPRTITKGMRVRQAVETLFEGFRDSYQPAKAWARRLMNRTHVADEEIQGELNAAIAVYCPTVPVDYVPFLVDLLSASIRLARRDGQLDREFVSLHGAARHVSSIVPLSDDWVLAEPSAPKN